MLHLLKRHPIPMAAHFRHCLVLTYALPRAKLDPLLPPGLEVDTYDEFGFVAIAIVRAECMRPVGLPAWMGRDFFLTGYRIFCRMPMPSGTSRRGLRILRSDTDSRAMTVFGNMLTHYAYRKADVSMEAMSGKLNVLVKTAESAADLDVTAELSAEPADLPPGSVFRCMADARQFAGPLPFTFDYESETHSIVAIKGVRTKWDPKPVRVDVRQCAFWKSNGFADSSPILSNAFYIDDIPYMWKRGVRHALPPLSAA